MNTYTSLIYKINADLYANDFPYILNSLAYLNLYKHGKRIQVNEKCMHVELQKNIYKIIVPQKYACICIHH